MAAKISLVLGGIRSGKSAFAEELAQRWGDRIIYVATGQPTDNEMAERIRRHRFRRPAQWKTIEEPLAVAEALEHTLKADPKPDGALVDSVDVWVANLLLAHEGEDPATTEELATSGLEQLVETCQAARVPAVLVSSEVGLSPVSPNQLGRRFQDLLGTVNQRTAELVDEAFLVVAGLPVTLKGSDSPPVVNGP